MMLSILLPYYAFKILLNSSMGKAVFGYSSAFPIGFEDDYCTATKYYILTIFLLVYHLYMK